MVFSAAVFNAENTDGENATVSDNAGRKAFIALAAENASRNEQFESAMAPSALWSVQFDAVPAVVSVVTVTTNFGNPCTAIESDVPEIAPSVAVTVCEPAVANVTAAVPTPFVNVREEKLDVGSELARIGVPA